MKTRKDEKLELCKGLIYGVKALGEDEKPEIIECEVKEVVTMTEK